MLIYLTWARKGDFALIKHYDSKCEKREETYSQINISKTSNT